MGLFLEELTQERLTCRRAARVDMAGEVTWQVKARWPEMFGERQAWGPGKDEAVIH